MSNVLVKGVDSLPILDVLTHFHTIPTLNTSGKKAFENIVGKGENAGNQHFLLFPQCFLFFPTKISVFESLLF